MRCVAAIEKAHGAVGILVNNAGITRDNLLLRMKDEEWDAVLDTNLKSVFRLSRAVLRGMMKARAGRIINITSVVGASGNPGQANYAAAKAGIVGLTRSLAREIGSRGDHRQLRRARLHRHRHDARADRGAARRAARDRFRSGGSGSPTTSPRRCCSSRRRRRLTSPARRCTSTAACT